MHKDKIVKHIKRLIYVSDSFQQAEDLLAHVQSQELKVNDSLYTPMMAGIITTYGINFNVSNGLGSLPKSYEKFDDQKLAEAHIRLINARNQLYAHRDIKNTKSHSDRAYKIDVWLENGKLLFLPTMIDISHNRISDIQALFSFQRQRLQEDLDSKLAKIIDTTKTYNENEHWELGHDFP